MPPADIRNNNTNPATLKREVQAGLRRNPKMWGGERFRPTGNNNFRTLRARSRRLSVRNRARLGSLGLLWRNNNDNNNNNNNNRGRFRSRSTRRSRR